ncbi:gas vesicle protein GvpO [Actinomycetospora soli]|uniref:gas vesicle protein GvpO n=1 Tax=Actinomycetospora soli TaxID=2893887 RepID=UPI001E2D5D9C|nr:gas vesicle protein GvpO [Actinomycetospora soli]MCD2189584.1 gas vesicle protein [Actinomycetospora soli]
MAATREDADRTSGALGVPDVVAAVQDLAEDLGWQWETLAGLRRTTGDAGGWTATLDVVETSRVPSTTDVIGVYEIELDEEAGLLGFRRLRHYVRGQGDNRRD